MIKYPNLVPECNVETLFVEALGYKKPNHAPSITKVSSILEQKRGNEKVIGFIDDDKKKPAYLKKFKVIKTFGGVTLCKHPQKEQYLVIAKPAMDKLIFDMCPDIVLSSLKLPREFEQFKAMTKKEAIRNNPKFKNLLNTIVQKSPEINAIKNFISSLGFNPY